MTVDSKLFIGFEADGKNSQMTQFGLLYVLLTRIRNHKNIYASRFELTKSLFMKCAKQYKEKKFLAFKGLVKQRADATAYRYAGLAALLDCKSFTADVAKQVLTELKSIDKFQGYAENRWDDVGLVLKRLVDEEANATGSTKPDDNSGGHGGGPDNNGDPKEQKKDPQNKNSSQHNNQPPDIHGNEPSSNASWSQCSKKSECPAQVKLRKAAVRSVPVDELELKIQSYHNQEALHEEHKVQLAEYAKVRQDVLAPFAISPEDRSAQFEFKTQMRQDVEARDSWAFRQAVSNCDKIDFGRRQN